MSKVYFLRIKNSTPKTLIESGKKISKVFSGFFDFKDRVAIKLHFGEKGNKNYVNPVFVKEIYKNLAKKVKEVCLMDSNVLYKGERTQASTHIKLAKEHGFDFAKIVIADGEFGEDEIRVGVNQKHFDFIKIGKALKNYNSILAISHITGHGGTGYAGALKNIGMGLGSRAGKLEMHKAFKLEVDKTMCKACGLCAKECPAGAIEINKFAHIDQNKCIGCAKCISVCPNDSVLIPWGAAASGELQERIVEYCYGILKNTFFKKRYFLNVLLNITENCDCIGRTEPPMVKDVGILGSNDIVSIEKATLDLMGKKYFERDGVNPLIQINYAREIELGEKDYKLIEIK